MFLALVRIIIVVVLVGALGITVYLAFDPPEQAKIKRDEFRKSAIGEIGEAVGKYYREYKSYPGAISQLVSEEFLDNRLKNIEDDNFSLACSGKFVKEAGFCYSLASGKVSVFTKLESKAQRAYCLAHPDSAYYLWSSDTNKSQIVCQIPN